MRKARTNIAQLCLSIVIFSCAVPVLFLGGRHLLHLRAAHNGTAHRTMINRQDQEGQAPLLTLDKQDMAAIDFKKIGNGVLEFEWGGQMHDVHRIDTINDQIFKLYGEVDHEESVLTKVFSDYIQRAKKKYKSHFFLFYFNDGHWLAHLWPSFVQWFTGFGLNNPYSSPLLETDTPPPKF